jgi:hypothetical protein
MLARNLGSWPIQGQQARESKDLVKISRENMLKTIHGEKHPVPMTFFVSNDVIHMGEFCIPSGGEGSRATEPDSHPGDAVFYVERGPITFFLPDSYDAFEVQEKEAFYLPSGTVFQCINYSANTVKTIFSVAPGL